MLTLLAACSFTPPAPLAVPAAPPIEHALDRSRCGPVPSRDPGIPAISQTVEVPMARNAAGLYTVEVLIAGVPRGFVVDTAAGAHVLRREHAEALGLVGTRMDVGTASTAIEGEQVSTTLTIGGVAFEDQPVVVLADEALTARVLGIPVVKIDGVLGWPLLGAGHTTLDFADLRLTLAPPTVDPEGAPMAWSDAPVVGGQVGRTGARWILDSGASRTMLHQEVATAAGIVGKPAGTIEGGLGREPIPIERAGGVELQAMGLRRRFDTIDVTLRRTGPADLCEDGALGVDFLEGTVLELHGPGGRAELRVKTSGR